MIYLTATTDTFDLVTSSAASTDVVACWVDAATSTLAVSGSGRTCTNISSATTTGNIVASPAASTTRTLKQLTIRNKDSSLSCDYTFRINLNGTAYELHKVTLQPGWMLIYIEGIGFFVNTPVLSKSGLKGVSTGDQSLTAGSANFLTGSAIALPSTVPAGLVLRWRVESGKTAAGTGTTTLGISFGTAGTTADTVRCSSGTLDTETAVADEAVDDITAIIRGPIGASCIVQSSFMRNNNLSTTGFSNTARKAQIKAVQSSAFDITPAGTIAGLQYTPGAADVTTVRQVIAEMLYLNG